jgi:hypothetical protein
MYITGRFQRPKPLLLGIYIGMAEAAPDTRLAFLRKASAPQTQGPSTALADSRANRPAALGMTMVVALTMVVVHARCFGPKGPLHDAFLPEGVSRARRPRHKTRPSLPSG